MHALERACAGLLELEQVLSSSLGPLGADKLVVNELQQVLSTSSSRDMLAVMHPPDPLVGLAVSSAQEFLVSNGDGGKRLLLMVSSGLRAALQEPAAAGVGGGAWHGSSQPRMAALVHALGSVQGYAEEVAELVAGMQAAQLTGGPAWTQPAMQLGPGTSQTSAVGHGSLAAAAGGALREQQQQQEEKEGRSRRPNRRRQLRAVLATAMTNRAGAAALKTLPELLAELVAGAVGAFSPVAATVQQATGAMQSLAASILGASEGGGSPWQSWAPEALDSALQQLCTGFDRHVVVAPGLPVSQSRLVQGSLLRLGVLMRPPQMPQSTPVRFMVLHCPLEPPGLASVGDARLLVSSAEQYRQLLGARSRWLQEVLGVLRARGVSLLLCTQRVGEEAAFLCAQAGITLFAALEDDEALALCAASGVTPVTHATLACLKAADMGTASQVELVALGPRERVLALTLQQRQQPSQPEQQQQRQVPTLLLHAPSEGLCRHYARLLLGGLRMLAQAAAHEARQGPAAAPAAGAEVRSLPMRFLPGGCAFHAALAAVLERHMDMAKHGAWAGPPGQHLSSGHGSDSRFSGSGDSPATSTQGTRNGQSIASWVQALDKCAAQHLAGKANRQALPALRLLHAMAVACPAALALAGAPGRGRPAAVGGASSAAATGGFGDAGVAVLGTACVGGGAGSSSRALPLLHQLLQEHREAMSQGSAGLGVSGAAEAEAAEAAAMDAAGQVQHQGRRPGPSLAGLLVSAPAPWTKPKHTFVGPSPPTTTTSAAARCAQPTCRLPSTSLAAYGMVVGSPAAHGLVEPMQHALALWGTALSLVMQLLRVDSLAAARRIKQPEGALALSKPQPGGQSAKPRKGGAAAGGVAVIGDGGDWSDGSGSGGEAGTNSSGDDA